LLGNNSGHPERKAEKARLGWTTWALKVETTEKLVQRYYIVKVLLHEVWSKTKVGSGDLLYAVVIVVVEA
jgi:hypothetical protein